MVIDTLRPFCHALAHKKKIPILEDEDMKARYLGV